MGFLAFVTKELVKAAGILLPILPVLHTLVLIRMEETKSGERGNL